uniref:Uncharacterized protein n=1 Tax=Ditylenchus dipsaci TaxID=166011 RepID=A0A915E4U5_9BILA
MIRPCNLNSTPSISSKDSNASMPTSIIDIQITPSPAPYAQEEDTLSQTGSTGSIDQIWTPESKIQSQPNHSSTKPSKPAFLSKHISRSPTKRLSMSQLNSKPKAQ